MISSKSIKNMLIIKRTTKHRSLPWDQNSFNNKGTDQTLYTENSDKNSITVSGYKHIFLPYVNVSIIYTLNKSK